MAQRSCYYKDVRLYAEDSDVPSVLEWGTRLEVEK